MKNWNLFVAIVNLFAVALNLAGAMVWGYEWWNPVNVLMTPLNVLFGIFFFMLWYDEGKVRDSLDKWYDKE